MNLKARVSMLLVAGVCLAALPAAAGAIPRGYFLVQLLETFSENKFGAINRVEDAEKIFSFLRGKINGLEYQTLYFDDASLDVHKRIALKAGEYGIDLWATTWGLINRISIKAFGAIKQDYQAWVMRSDGSLVPAMVEGQPLFDVLNPDAVAWAMKVYTEKYLVPFKGLLAGMFLNEDTIPYLGKIGNDLRYDYWNLPVYSSAVLREWRSYCAAHNVVSNGKIVTVFPVHRLDMVARGNGLTAYYEGYDVPERIYAGQRFVDLPQAKGIWKHWYDFLSQQFIHTWIQSITRAANEVNKDNPSWRGTIYFAAFYWSLPYEEIRNEKFTVPAQHHWGAWGRQRGMDLKVVCSLPGIDAVVCETYPPIKANLEYYIEEYDRISAGAGKQFGVMLHRDDSWKLRPDEELLRWALIEKYRPQIIVRYPLGTMLPWGRYYDESRESTFFKRLKEYRAVLN